MAEAKAWHQAQVRRNPRDTFREKLQLLVDEEARCDASRLRWAVAEDEARRDGRDPSALRPPADHEVRLEVPTWKFDEVAVALSSPCDACLAAASDIVDRVMKAQGPRT